MTKSLENYKLETQVKEEARRMTVSLMDDVLSSKNIKLK